MFLETNVYLLISVIFLFTLVVGKLLNKVKLPWIFSALLVGILFSFVPIFDASIISSDFQMLAEIGMLMLLFLIGLEIDLKHVAQNGTYILGSAAVIIFLEAIVGTLFIYFAFNTSLNIAILVALSFATVGEAVLVPILESFSIMKTALGSSLLAIGKVDDLVEVVALVATVSLIDFNNANQILFSVGALGLLFALTLSFTKIKKRTHNFDFHPVETIFLFTFFVFFLFIGIGMFADAASLGALLAGISIRQFMPEKRLSQIENQVKAVGYGLFAPLFFVSIGYNIEIKVLVENFWLVILAVFLSAVVKIFASILTSRRKLGLKGSILLGVGLSVKFSLSLVIITLLHTNGLIDDLLYSIMLGSSMIFVLVMPLLFSQLISRWQEHIPLTYRILRSVQKS